MGEKIQVQNFVFLTSELKSTHNFSLENMFCSIFETLHISTHLAVKSGSDLKPCHTYLVQISLQNSGGKVVFFFFFFFYVKAYLGINSMKLKQMA